jgi:hypothetical protein
MLWFWLNVPLAVAFIGAWCGIPLAKVLRNPDWGPQPAGGHRVQPTGPAPAGAVVRSEPRVGAPALAGTPR